MPSCNMNFLELLNPSLRPADPSLGPTDPSLRPANSLLRPTVPTNLLHRPSLSTMNPITLDLFYGTTLQPSMCPPLCSLPQGVSSRTSSTDPLHLPSPKINGGGKGKWQEKFTPA